MKVRYGSIVLLLLFITAAAFGICALFGVQSPATQGDFSVVASFYPLYTVAKNVVGDCEGVSVECLTQPTTGCLHDYQLSPAERVLLETADVLLLNGAGMEEFLESTLASLPARKTVDTSKGIELLACEEHEHEEHEGHEHTVNAHVWVDPVRYGEQVKAVRDALCEADPAHAAAYTANAAAYLQKIAAVQQELQGVALPFDSALLFHDSMAYVAQALSLKTVGTLPLGENEAASASELKAAADAVSGQAVLLLYDTQYPALYESLADYAAKAAAVYWNIAVQPIQGVAETDVWLYAMEQNIRAVKEAAK